MWCPSLTAFYGSGESFAIPQSDKLGGFVVKQITAADLETPWITRFLFDELSSGYTMKELYGSDFTSFSAGGFVWASEMTANILTPAASLVGSYYKGTIMYGQLANKEDMTDGLSLQNLI